MTGDALAKRSADTGSEPSVVPNDIDLIEWYYEKGYSDGFPVVPPTPEKVEAMLAALGGDPDYVEARVPPRWGNLTREVLAINMVMAGCKTEYAPVVQVRNEIGMNSGHNVFGSGNRANATIGRAIRMVLLNVGGGWPGELDKSTLGSPAKYTYCIAENEEIGCLAPYHVEKGFDQEDSTVFVMPAEPPHSVTNHVSDDPEGILDSIVSAMSTIAHNNAVSAGHCAVVIGPEHAKVMAKYQWTRHDIRHYLWYQASNTFGDVAFQHRYGKVYNRSLPKWYKRDVDARIPVVPTPDHIHLFCAGGEAGRFSAFIPGWGHMASPVLRELNGRAPAAGGMICEDGTCHL
jgi:hypothetical protein